jgi:hypothetical protein
MLGLLRARKTPVCRRILGSPADLWPPVFPGFRREARLTPGYGRPAFQAEDKRPRSVCNRARVYSSVMCLVQFP